MMTEVVLDDVKRAATALLATLQRLHMAPEDAILGVHRGSVKYGDSWRVYYVTPQDRTNHVDLPAVDLHGAYTAREAYGRIIAANHALRAVEQLPRTFPPYILAS